MYPNYALLLVSRLKAGLLNRIILVFFCAILIFLAPEGKADDNDNNPFIQDLYFREVLFYLYQKQHLPALIQLVSAELSSSVNTSNDEIELIAAKLYLSYGLHQKAEQLLNSLIKQGKAKNIPAPLWLELAKIQYHQHSSRKAAQTLAKIDKSLPRQLQEEKELLSANLLIASNRLDRLNTILGSYRNSQTQWQYYARYNLAIAYIKDGKNDKAQLLLVDLGKLSSNNEESKAIIDKANLTLGFLYLDSQNPQSAKAHFENIRLNGPFSNRALLGMGWTYTTLGEYKQALTPWLLLKDGATYNPAVQEALSAIPYALEQLKAYKQSIEQYQEAIVIYNKELKHIETVLENVFARGWLATLPDPDLNPAEVHQAIMASALKEPYFGLLVESMEFQSILNNYSALIPLQQTLEDAIADILLFRSVISELRHIYKERPIETLDINAAAAKDLRKLIRQQRKELIRIKNTKNTLALMSGKERHNLAMLDLIEENIDDLAMLFSIREIDDKLRIYRGIILWDIITYHDARADSAQQTLKRLENTILKMESRRKFLKNPNLDGLKRLDDFEERMNVMAIEISDALSQVKTARQTQEATLDVMAIAALEEQKTRLTTYINQAHIALAQLFDHAFTSKINRAQP